MQRNVTYCDACQSPDLESGYAVISVSGDRSATIKSRIQGGRNTLDLCDACATALGEFITERGRPKVETPEPPAPSVDLFESSDPEPREAK